MIKAKTLQDLFKRYRRPGDLVFSVAFLAFSLFLLFTIDGQVKWGRGKLLAEPAFIPWVGVICMTVFAALHLVSGLMSPRLDGRLKEIGFWARSLEYVVWFLAYVIVVPRLGYLPTTMLFTPALAFRLGYRDRKMLVAAVIFGVIVVLLFKSFLQVKVPGGQIYEYLPTALRSFMLTYF